MAHNAVRLGTFILLSLVATTPDVAYCQRFDHPDTSRIYALNEMIVTGTRYGVQPRALPSAITSVSRQQIEASAGTMVSDALQGTTGLSVRSYGSVGALQSVSLRGMGGEHTLVLVDGQRYTNPQNGQTDVGVFLSSNIERIEIAKGGYSSLYGADAVGGVVNIVTRRPETGIHGEISTSFGSNGFYGYGLCVSGADSSLRWHFNGRHERGAGDYEFDFDDGGQIVRLRRSGADFSLLSLEGRMEYTPLDDVHSSITLSYGRADRGTPGAFTDRYTQGLARLSDATGRVHLKTDCSLSRILELSLNASCFDTHETYNDPHLLVNNESLRSEHTNWGWSFDPELHLGVSPGVSGVVGCEVSGAEIRSSEVRNGLRHEWSAFLSTQHTISFDGGAFYEVVVYPSVRYDHFSDVGGDVSPRLGVNAGLLKFPDLRIRSSIAKSFRVPTFNDLYWLEGGNPFLRPERSFSAECGLMGAIGPLEVEINCFSIRTSDRIVWTPKSGGIWSPQNIAEVRSKGVESEARWSGLDGKLHITVNSTWMETQKESEDYLGDPTKGKSLIYVPRQTVNASALFVLAPLVFSIHHAWTSFRYTTEINDRFLPQHGVTSVAITFRQLLGSLKASLKLEATNLFNTSYQVTALYPMPLREVRGTFGVSL
jgi:iron complex outermembrane receptor protein